MGLPDDSMKFMGADRAQRQELRRKINMVTVAEHHIVWKSRLWHHMEGNMRESLDSSNLGQDSICLLSSWINSEVLIPLCEPVVYSQLCEAHEQFHSIGLQIIEKLKTNDRRSARALFEGEYTHALRSLIQALTAINRRLYED